MSFYPTFYSQYDQLLALQTQGIPKAEMKAARELSTYQVVQQLAARSPSLSLHSQTLALHKNEITPIPNLSVITNATVRRPCKLCCLSDSKISSAAGLALLQMYGNTDVPIVVQA